MLRHKTKIQITVCIKKLIDKVQNKITLAMVDKAISILPRYAKTVLLQVGI